MPLTVKFSEQFYRKLGHEAVDELVNWFNQVDNTYRGDLRELNELNFARFDAKLEQRLAEFGAGLRLEIGAVAAAVAQADAKTGQRLAQSDAKWEERLGELRAELGALHGGLRAELGALQGGLRAELGELRGDFRAQLKAEGKRIMGWMVGLWITAIGVLAGLIFGALHFLPAVRP